MTRHPEAISTKLFWIAEWLRSGNIGAPWQDEAKLVYDAGNLYLATEQADVHTPERAAAALADLQSSMSWALPQYKCGNMSEKAVFDYMFFCISRISPDITMRALVERLRLAQIERDHLKYVERNSPDIWHSLVREVIGEDKEFIGPEGARHGAELCSRLAESGWFKRARAALGYTRREQP